MRDAKQNEKGFTILVSIFLFLALSTLALSFGQVIVTDAKGVSVIQGGTIPTILKEKQRLLAFYMAQMGIHDIRMRLTNNPDMDTLPLTTVYSDDGAPNIMLYEINLAPDGVISDPNHNLLPDLIATSRGQIPLAAPIQTQFQMEERYWQSTRAYASGVQGSPPAWTDMPVQTMDTVDGDHLGTPTVGLEKDMSQRDTAGNPPSPQPTKMEMGYTWRPGFCAGSDCSDKWLMFDFGMPMQFDEIRFLQQYPTQVFSMTLETWDETSGTWATHPLKTFPPAGQYGDTSFYPSGFAPYYTSAYRSCAKEEVYNGDRCTNFLGLSIYPIWGDFGTYNSNPTNECFFTYYACGISSSTARSYIARYKLNYLVTARRAKLKFRIKGTDYPTLYEIGVYCCDSDYAAPDPFPSTSQNILRTQHGKARVLNTGAGSGGGPPVNSSVTQSSGDISHSKLIYE